MQKRYLIGGVLLLLLLIWAGGKYFATQKIEQLIDRANQDGNELTVGDWSLSFRFLTAGIEADSITLRQRLGGRELSGTVGHLDLSGAKVTSLLFGDYPKVSSLVLDRPDLQLSPVADTASTQQGASKDTAEDPFLSFYGVQINDGKLTYSETGEQPTVFLYGINVDQEQLILPFGKEDLDRLQLGVDSVHFPMPASAADWWMRGINIADEGGLSVGKITLEPRNTPVTHLENAQVLETWNALRIDSLSTSGFKLSNFFAKDSVSYLDRIDAQSLSFIVYERPDLPRPAVEKVKPMPVESLRQLPVKLTVGQLKIPAVKLTYGIVSSQLKDRTLEFTNGALTISNVSTFQQADPAVADIDITFDGATPLRAKFIFDQAAESGRKFSLQGNLGEYNLVKINPLMVLAADATVEAGQIHEIDYRADFNNEVVRGEMMFRYSNLKLHLEGSGAWIKNLLKGVAVKKNNPQEDGDLREGNIYVEHDNKRSFFNAYWKAIVSGLQSTAVGNLFIPDELESDKADDAETQADYDKKAVRAERRKQKRQN